jgi:hypothetical protein
MCRGNVGTVQTIPEMHGIDEAKVRALSTPGYHLSILSNPRIGVDWIGQNVAQMRDFASTYMAGAAEMLCMRKCNRKRMRRPEF